MVSLMNHQRMRMGLKRILKNVFIIGKRSVATRHGLGSHVWIFSLQCETDSHGVPLQRVGQIVRMVEPFAVLTILTKLRSSLAAYVLDQIRDRMKQGESAAIHCAYGHCRTGMAATLLLARMGLPFQESVDAIAHAGSTPSAKLKSEFQ